MGCWAYQCIPFGQEPEQRCRKACGAVVTVHQNTCQSSRVFRCTKVRASHGTVGNRHDSEIKKLVAIQTTNVTAGVRFGRLQQVRHQVEHA